MHQIIYDDHVAADHQTNGHQEEENKSHKVDRVIRSQVDDVLHLDAGGEVGHLVRVVPKEEHGQSAAQSH